jgi:hypothetical protein
VDPCLHWWVCHWSSQERWKWGVCEVPVRKDD